MALFDWKSDFSVGVFNMDAHHRKLFDIMNKLHDAMKQGSGEAAIKSTIRELLDYTKYHFGEEEKLMERINYAGLSVQKKAHENFIAKIEEFQKEAEQPGMAIFVVSKVSNTAVNWLKEHILRIDKLYQKDMNAQGIK